MKSTRNSNDDTNSASSLVGEKKGNASVGKKKKSNKQSLAEARKEAALWHERRANAKGRKPSEHVQDNQDEKSTCTTDSPGVPVSYSFFSKKEKIVKKSNSHPPTSTVVENKSSKPALSKKEKLAKARSEAQNWHKKRIENKDSTFNEDEKSTSTTDSPGVPVSYSFFSKKEKKVQKSNSRPPISTVVENKSSKPALRKKETLAKARSEAHNWHKKRTEDKDKTSAEKCKSARMHSSSKATSEAINSYTKRINEDQDNASKKDYAELDSDEESETETETEIETKKHLPVTSTRSQSKLSFLFWMLAILLAFGAVSEVCNSIGSFMSMGFTALDKITSKPVPRRFESSFFAKQELKIKDDPSSLQDHHEKIEDIAKEKYLAKAEGNYNELDTAPQSRSTSCPDQMNLLQDAYISGMKESNSVAPSLNQIWWTIGFVILTAAVVSMAIAIFDRCIGRKVPLKPRAVYKMTRKAVSDASEDFIVLE